MDATNKAGAGDSNINHFEPLSDFVQEADCDTLLVYLPGFVKEQLRVQLARSGVLKISGTRSLGGNKWSSFQKEFPVSADIDTSKITAKFEEGTLYVRQPKLIAPPRKEDNITPPIVTKTSSSNNQEKAAGDKNTPPLDNKEAKKTIKDEQKISESTKEKSDERIQNAQDKSAATSDERGKKDAEVAKKVDGDRKLLDAKRQPVTRQKMTIVLIALFAFALGVCIKNLQGWFSHPVDE